MAKEKEDRVVSIKHGTTNIRLFLTITSELEEVVKKSMPKVQDGYPLDIRGPRYTPGSRLNPIMWQRSPVLRTALIIGHTVFAFYRGSMVRTAGQRSVLKNKNRITLLALQEKCVAFVHRVYPKFTEIYGHDLDTGGSATLAKKIYNQDLNAEFEYPKVLLDDQLAMYVAAMRLMFRGRSILRELGITPTTANGVSRQLRGGYRDII